MPNAALILAAGRGSRIQDLTSDKVVTDLGGRAILTYSIEAFVKSGCVTTIAVVYRDESQRLLLQAAVESVDEGPQNFLWVRGGAERQDSVLSGLKILPDEIDQVFIHDAARPLITPEAIRLLSEKAGENGAACLARRVTDTIKEVRPTTDLSRDTFLLKTIDRSQLWAVETPQVFNRALILAAYEKIHATGQLITDDTAALEESGHPVALVANPSPNPKLTTSSDLAYIEYLLKSRTEALQ